MPNGVTKFFLFTLLSILGACASGPTARQTYFDEEFKDVAYGNFLVIGIAGSYNSRAQFERKVASTLRSEGVSATPFHTVAAGNEPLSREAVLEVVKANGYDAVLVTRVLSQQADFSMEGGSTNTKASTMGGGPVNFFRYNYEELNEPGSLNVAMAVTLTSELFSAAEEKMIWSIETSNSDASNVGVLIDATAERIVRKLASDGLVSR